MLKVDNVQAETKAHVYICRKNRCLKYVVLQLSHAGTRVSVLDESATHVILGGYDNADISRIAAMAVKPIVVVPRWVCVRVGR